MHVLIHLPGAATSWGFLATPELDQTTPSDAVHALESQLAGWAEVVSGEASLELNLEVLKKAAETCAAEVVVLGMARNGWRGGVAWLESVASRCGIPAMWVGDERSAQQRSPQHFLVPFETEPRSLAPAAVFLRDRLDENDRVTLLALSEAPPSHMAQLAGLSAPVQLERFEAGLSDFSDRLAALVAARGVDVILLPRATLGALTGLLLRVVGGDALEGLGAAVIVLPEAPVSVVDSLWQGRLDAPDVLRPKDGPLSLLVERLDMLGRPGALDQAQLEVVAAGKLLGHCSVHDGLASVSLGGAPTPTALGLGRSTGEDQDPLLAVELGICVVDPRQRQFVLLDPDLDEGALRQAALVAAEDSALIAVRLRPEQSFLSLRSHLAACGLADVPLLASRLVLNDGQPDDQPSGTEALRLVRVAARLRVQGLAVTAMISAGRQRLEHRGCTMLTSKDLEQHPVAMLQAQIRAHFEPPNPDASSDLGVALAELTGARAQGGNSIEILLDNGHARHNLFACIDRARTRIHMQVYIVRDDAFTRSLLKKLKAATQRGVRLRILVDSLFSMHGSFGQQNPVLTELESLESVEVRAILPVAHMPNLEDLKRRDHRKLWAFDGTRALVSGRNLAQEYYTGFDELALHPETPARSIPWLDAGATVAGPLVVKIEAAFMRTWLRAGGAPFSLRSQGAVGTTRVRLVLHEGCRDAHTLDAYLAIIRAAQTRLLIANTFPLQEELLHAILQAIQRGVRVRLLIGNVRPVFGPSRQPFPGVALRELATQVVLGRIDQLVAAGAEAYELTFSGLAGWHETLGIVRPHLHAKLVCADGLVCTVGSANLDIASGYWESESLLVIEDARVAKDLEAQLEDLLHETARIDPLDPTWQSHASWRAALTRLWPSVIA